MVTTDWSSNELTASGNWSDNTLSGSGDWGENELPTPIFAYKTCDILPPQAGPFNKSCNADADASVEQGGTPMNSYGKNADWWTHDKLDSESTWGLNTVSGTTDWIQDL